MKYLEEDLIFFFWKGHNNLNGFYFSADHVNAGDFKTTKVLQVRSLSNEEI